MTTNSSKISARNLRQEGLSIRDISRKLNIPISTTHLWVNDIVLNQNQVTFLIQRHYQALRNGQIKSLIEKRKIRAVEQQKLLNQGKTAIGSLSNREILLVCADLYWAEGFKKDSRLGFANSDPDMIKVILKWLLDIENVPKSDIRLRVGINISHQHRITSIQKQWAKITDIPESQFQKPFFQQTVWKKNYINQDKYLGVLRIRINGHSALYTKIKGMIEGLKQV